MKKTELYRLCFPYGMSKNEDGYWNIFNHQYEILEVFDTYDHPNFLGFDIPEKIISEIIDITGMVNVAQKSDGEIYQIWFNIGFTNPFDNNYRKNEDYQKSYYKILSLIANCKAIYSSKY